LIGVKKDESNAVESEWSRVKRARRPIRGCQMADERAKTAENKTSPEAKHAPELGFLWWALPGSNRQPKDYESPAPPLS
jgi:hypothetical protein